MLGSSWRQPSPSGQALMASSSLGHGCLHALWLYWLHQGMRLAAQAPTLCWPKPIRSHWPGILQQKDKVLLERSPGSPVLSVPREVGVCRQGVLCLGSRWEHLQLVRAQSSGWNDLQKGRSLGAIPLLPCWISWGAGAPLKGLFLLSFKKSAAVDLNPLCYASSPRPPSKG